MRIFDIEMEDAMNKVVKKCKNAYRIFRSGGVKAISSKLKENREAKKINMLDGYDFIMNQEKIPFDQNAYHKLDATKGLVINWVIPLPGIGSGGHINIFRFICNLQNMGFKNRVYAMNGSDDTPDEVFHDFVKRYYGVTDTTLELHYGTKRMECAHATIATSWETAYIVNNFDNTVSKFYFVQDFEPYFFPLGSRYAFAENTYRFGFRGITAGDWLKDKLRDEYGMETASFGFSYDRDIYRVEKKEDDVKRVFYYARPMTERRSFEMGMLVLRELYRRMPELEIVIAGASLEEYHLPFPAKELGTVALKDLSHVYAQCDLCLVLSHTNLSLLPLEIMASGSVVVCNQGANSDWLVNDHNAVMTQTEPHDIVDKMEYYLKNADALSEKREAGILYATNTSWEEEAKKVAGFIQESVETDMKSL
ncbi:MAG: glycosyltransferase [Lachnospiraceae bacterium]